MNSRKLIAAFLTTSTLLLASCDNEGDSRLIENARLEGREQAKGELEAQIENKDALIRKAREEGRAVAEQELLAQIEVTTARARAMEKDLAKRQRFYQAAAGTYEGELATEEGKYRVKISLVPTLSPFEAERVRMPEEIAQDLNLLSFSVQVVEWNPANSLSAVGCRVENIHPDLTRGVITISKESCASVYSLKIGASKISAVDSKGAALSATERARKTADAVLAGKVSSITEIHGEKRPTTNAQEYSFSLRKRD